MIIVLDKFVADKIAAGEVIERPLSIIKELVENSIDAGASSIIVEIRNGGKSYIRVTDDGCGIPADEVEIAFERHATGKISGLADLDRIETLGFRGEALASIAAVSRLTIYTRTEEESSGVKLVLYGGKKISFEETGINTGTTILVEDVFYNTPARRKFMKSDAAEASVIVNLIQKIALSRPDISFRLINNGQTLVSSTGDGSRRNAIFSVFPSPEYGDLIEVEGKYVTGFISKPSVTKNSRRGQIFFVNGRLIHSETLERGIADGYGDRIFSGHPIVILFISVDPSTIDVNIHPNKREIKFLDSDEIRRNIATAVSNALLSEASVAEVTIGGGDYEFKEKQPELLSEQLGIREYLERKPREQAADVVSDVVSKEIKSTVTSKGLDLTIDSDDFDITISSPEDDIISPKLSVRPFDFEDLEIRGYVFNAYIITQSREALYIFDQHAAHERILYERLLNRYNSDLNLSQPVITPFTIEVSADVYNGERDYLAVLDQIGYDIEDFGNSTFIIRGIPADMTGEEAVNFAKDFIDFSEGLDRTNKRVIDKLIMRSCKSAVKANDRLTEMEIRELLTALSKCTNPFSCPHGRPTFIRVTKYELEKSFKRK